MSKYDTNLAAEYYVLSTLYRLGFDAYLTLGNKKSVDIIISKPEQNLVTIDVKGLADAYDWPADNYKRMDAGHYYVLICYEGKIGDPSFIPNSWIIPATSINEFFAQYANRKNVSRSLILEKGTAFKDNWEALR
jgi:hypothetical protein